MTTPPDPETPTLAGCGGCVALQAQLDAVAGVLSPDAMRRAHGYHYEAIQATIDAAVRAERERWERGEYYEQNVGQTSRSYTRAPTKEKP